MKIEIHNDETIAIDMKNYFLEAISMWSKTITSPLNKRIFTIDETVEKLGDTQTESF